MAPLITTYRHDYINPREMSLNFRLTAKKPTDASELQCLQCERTAEEETLVDQLNEQCGATAAGTGHSEWTGIAPMGALIKPRIIPGAEDDETEKTDPCFIEKPNKYLNNLPNSDPTLYDKLRFMNKDDLQKVINNDRLKSTYQVDYGGIAEYPLGTYIDEEDCSPEGLLAAAQSEALPDPCGDEALLKDHVPRRRKCFKPIVRTNVCCKHCPAIRGHWQAAQNKGSEYTAKVGEVGAIILKNRLNDHCKCTEAMCQHPIMYNLIQKCK